MQYAPIHLFLFMIMDKLKLMDQNISFMELFSLNLKEF